MRKVPDDERLAKIFSVRFNQKTVDALRDAAEAEQADVADLIRDAVTAYLDKKHSGR